MSKRHLFTLIVMAALLTFSSIVTAQNRGGRSLTTTLTGAAEIPGPGDPDGSGEATIRLNQGRPSPQL